MTKSEQSFKCSDCDLHFIFSVQEQEHFASKKLTPPAHCHNCRVLRWAEAKGKENRPITAIVCASCHCLTYVQFKPNGQKPIYCVSCYNGRHLGLCV